MPHQGRGTAKNENRTRLEMNYIFVLTHQGKVYYGTSTIS
jgi:hypothetical protein